jgi:uncharacterized protein (DUF1800 family)
MKFPAFAVTLALATLASPASGPDDAKLFRTKLDKEQQILHALDRLTFGPRTGDVERVRALGLKKWIELQLNPDRIPEDPDLETKLRPLASLDMSPLQVVQHYPPPQLIRAIAMGKEKLPDDDPLLRASLVRLVARYKVNKDEKNVDPNAEMEPARPMDEVLDAGEIKTLQTGTVDEKRALLASLPEDRLDGVIVSLPQNLRRQLTNIAPTAVRRKFLLLQNPQAVVNFDLVESKLLRAIYSNRQLAEELDDFWFNHFNVNYDKGADHFDVPSYEREAIRPYVLGHFRYLLEATAKSPAMLFYLDNFQSVRADIDAKVKGNRPKRGLNENYARELMELHTLGVNGGYTQQDVIEVARCFTGWGIKEPRKGGNFFYNDKVHDKGEKIVLGHVIPAGGGEKDGERVLDILAAHPSTARFISRKLAQRFVADNPPQALLDKMAKTFLDKQGDIREVMRTMLNQKEFWSQGAYQAKVKTPFEMVASSVRALNGEVTDAFALSNQVSNLGEPLYRKLEPTGYSNLNAEWVNSGALLGRMNFALALAQNKVAGVKVDTARFTSDPAETARVLLYRNLSAPTQAAITRALADQKDKTPAAAISGAMVAGLLIGSPEFQRR